MNTLTVRRDKNKQQILRVDAIASLNDTGKCCDQLHAQIHFTMSVSAASSSNQRFCTKLFDKYFILPFT